MRKNKGVMGLLAVLIILFIFMTSFYVWQHSAWQNNTSPVPSATPLIKELERRHKIGFANLTDEVSFPQKVKKSIEQEALKYDVELLVADNQLDGATALRHAEQFIEERVDLVIEFQTDERYGNIIMDRLRLAGIPVIAVDIPMPGAVFFGADNYRAGYMAGTALGEAIQKQWDGKLDRLFMLELPQSGPIPAARVQGQRDGLEAVVGSIPEEQVIHLNSKNTFEESERLVAEQLEKLPAGTKMAFVNINDDTALGSLKALEDAGRTGDALIVSQNGTEPFLEAMRDSQSPLVGSTAYFPEKYGEKLIPAAIKIIEGEQVPPYLFTDHVFIDRNNLHLYVP